MKIENKVVVVTGGSGGIGQALAISFINENAKVVILLDINFDHFESKNDKLITKICDVTNEKELSKNFSFETYLKAVAFSNSVAELAEVEGHHPYIHINFKNVKIILFTHKIDGLHENDFLMASKIDQLID